MKLSINKIIFFKSCFVLILLCVSVSVFGQTASSTQTGLVNLTVTCPDDICLFRGCTDKAANNYDALAGYDDGSCKYNEVVISPVYGCTDPEALNYNALATADNGSCSYNVPNVSNFRAVVVEDSIKLIWSKPSLSTLASVTIVRAAGHIPSGLGDGDVVYEGTGSSYLDSDVVAGVTYYYLAVVTNNTGDESSGAVTSAMIPKTTTPTEEPTNPENPTGNQSSGRTSSGGSIGIVGPFETLATSTVATATAQVLTSLDKVAELFVISQPGETTKSFFNGSYLKIRGNKPFTVSVDYYKMPEVLKTIGMTIYNLNNTEENFSFLLKLNEAKTAYEATVSALPEDGVYGVSLYLINYEDQTIKKYNGQIAVVGSLGILGVGPEKFVRQVAGPVVVSSGVAAGFAQLLFSSSGLGSFSELYLLLLRQFGALLGYLGLKKKNKPWGTVYDSVTKRPLDPAYVSVLAEGEEIATAITDIDGRYGFSLLDGNYTLTAHKTHYRFPSAILAGRVADEMYGDLYFGETFHLGASEVISRNIPLDPLDFDWNEFAKSQGGFLQVFSKQELWRAKLVRVIFRLGLVMSIFYLIFYPSILNILVPLLYLAIALIGRYYRQRHKVVTVKNKTTGEPLSFAIIEVYYAGLDQLVKKVVTDMVGRFYLLLRPGDYYLIVNHKQPDGTYARLFKTPPAHLAKGIWTDDLLV